MFDLSGWSRVKISAEKLLKQREHCAVSCFHCFGESFHGLTLEKLRKARHPLGSRGIPTPREPHYHTKVSA